MENNRKSSEKLGQPYFIKISADENHNFFSLFDALGDREKEIWKVMVWYTKRFPNAHPCQATIAQKIGCTREHVNRTISKFKKYHWVSLASRGYKRAKIIIIPHHLVMIDLVERQYFKRIEITSKITYNYSSEKTTSRDGSSSKKKLDLPDWIANTKNFSLDSKLKLSLLSEHIYEEAKHVWEKQTKRGFKPDNPEKYFVGTAFKIAEKQGFKPKWREYYQRL